MFTTRIAVAIAVLAAALALGGGSASAAPPTPIHKQLNASQCNTGSAPVVNVTFNVVNDFDSGLGGIWWAVDSYNKQLQVWAQGDGTFCAVVKYEGQFVTRDGLSPGNTGTLAAGIQGTMNGGYVALLSGTLAPALATTGNLGTYDYHCQTGCAYFGWVGAYFSGVSGFTQPYWAWSYKTPANGSWLNASTGNAGDITGAP